MILRLVGVLLLVVPTSPVPVRDLLIHYFEGGYLARSRAEAEQSVLGRQVLAELESLPIDRQRLRPTSGEAVRVRTTLREGVQDRVRRVVGDQIWERPKSLRYGFAAVDPATGGVSAWWPKEYREADAVNDAVRTRSLELASAYATLAAGGVYRKPHLVHSVGRGLDGTWYRADETGKPVFSRNPARSKEIADHFTGVLKQNPVCGGVACVPGSAGSMASCTPELAVAVVVDQVGGAVDADLPRTIWRKFLAG